MSHFLTSASEFVFALAIFGAVMAFGLGVMPVAVGAVGVGLWVKLCQNSVR